MTTKDVKKWIKENLIRENGTLISVRCSFRWVRKQSEEVASILEQFEKPYHANRFQHILYDFLNDITEPPKCYCGKFCTHHGFGYGYGKHCSLKCSTSDKIVQEKQKKTLLEKYGVIHQMHLDFVKEKQRKTFFERTGYDHNFKLPTAHHAWPSYEKRKEIMQEKYGVDNPFQLDFVKEKIKQTTKERYGTICYTVSEAGRKRFIKTRRKNMFEKFKHVLSLKQLTLLESEVYLNGGLPQIKCNMCSTVFEAQSSTAAVVRCPRCSKVRESREEFELREWLNSQGFNFQRNTEVIAPLELDMYDENSKFAVEFNGLYWHSELYKEPNYHLNKTLKCAEKEIKLIHIFENEWIQNSEKVKSLFLKSLGKIAQIETADLRKISKEETENFILENSLELFNPKFSVSYGLFYEEKLVACCSFKKSKNVWEMVNVCEHLNCRVKDRIKLFAGAQVGNLVTKCNRRFLAEHEFINEGFRIQKYTKPSFMYWKKSSLELVTEKLGDDYFRVYDCGQTILTLER